MQLPHGMPLGREMQCNCVSDPALVSVYYIHSMPLISIHQIQHVAPLDLVKHRVILVGVTRGLYGMGRATHLAVYVCPACR